jgi:hypothetical protein
VLQRGPDRARWRREHQPGEVLFWKIDERAAGSPIRTEPSPNEAHVMQMRVLPAC